MHNCNQIHHKALFRIPEWRLNEFYRTGATMMAPTKQISRSQPEKQITRARSSFHPNK